MNFVEEKPRIIRSKKIKTEFVVFLKIKQKLHSC